MSYSPTEIMQAHQYLYYVGPAPIWSDFRYDVFCKENGLDGIGGSDRASDYSDRVIALAEKMHANPNQYPPPA